MRRVLLLGIAVGLVSAGVAAGQDASVVYFEGDPVIRNAAGDSQFLDFGTSVIVGESVVTGSLDFVELAQGAATTIRVDPDTVFTVQEREVDGQRQSVLTTAAGSVAYRFNRIAGREEPRVGSMSVVAGIRGTELTVYAGPDGSTLFLVEEGAVAVSSAGATVELGADQGVEVAAGAVPGEPFSLLGREFDYGSWEAGRRDAFLTDPLGATAGHATQLQQFAAEMQTWVERFEEARVLSDEAVQTMNSIADTTERMTYRNEVWAPLSQQTGVSILNYRFYALSALSFKRYVIGPSYMEMKTRNILAPTPEYAAYLEAYEAIVREFDAVFEPYLEDFDR